MKFVPQFGCVSQDSDSLVSQRGKTAPGKPDAQSLGTDSKSTVHFRLRNVMRVSGKRKDHRLEKKKVKPRHQRSPYAMNFEDRPPRRDWKTRAMCPKQGLESCPKHLQPQSERPNYILLCLRTSGYSRLRQTKEPEEGEFVADSRASMHFIGIHTTGSAVRNHISSEMAIELIAIYRTMDHMWFLVYQRVLPQPHLHLLLHHLHHWIPYLTKADTPENPVSERSGSTSEELRGNLQHKPTETENNK